MSGDSSESVSPDHSGAFNGRHIVLYDLVVRESDLVGTVVDDIDLVESGAGFGLVLVVSLVSVLVPLLDEETADRGMVGDMLHPHHSTLAVTSFISLPQQRVERLVHAHAQAQAAHSEEHHSQ